VLEPTNLVERVQLLMVQRIGLGVAGAIAEPTFEDPGRSLPLAVLGCGPDVLK